MESSGDVVSAAIALVDYIDSDVLGEMLSLGGLGFVAGVILPFSFRLIGYVIDSVRVVIGKD